ncbi:MAG: glycosyltransferase [Rhizobiaceae bacterium]|nr:MAG: glycosyltransferase [Rhizobiaceae bacterium]
MHLVFATSIVPGGSPTTGYEIANAAILDGFRRAGVRVSVLGYAWPGRKREQARDTVVLGEVDVRTDSASALQKIQWLTKAVGTGRTFSSVKLAALPERAIRTAIEQIGPFDAYIINAVQFAGAFPDLFADRPSIYIAHNVEFRSAEENAAAASDLLQKFLFRREARLLSRLEETFCRRARFVLTLAEEDRAILGVDGAMRSAALPLVTCRKPPAPSPRKPETDAALIGTWTWQPNRIGLDWFLGEVVPHLPRDFSIRLAGNIPAGFRCSLPNVEIVGRVPDAAEFVRGAHVVPLISRAGTGVQLKTIEAFELGLPAVATRQSLRGIAHIPENCVVEDDPERFAAALVRAREGATDLDGTAFHQAQMKALDAVIRKSLAMLTPQPQEVAA